MATLDDDLANAVTEGFRQAQIDIVNQDLILSGTGDVTVTLANGSKKTGPSWSKLITAANAAGTSAAAAEASAKNAKTSETNANSSKNAAATSEKNAKTSETNAGASETNAAKSASNAKTSENNAGTSASSAAASLAAAQQLTSVPYEAAPFPDVWAPLNDDLRLLAGFAPYDKLTISGQVLELPSKSLSFARASTATYIDKSGVLKTAAVNEARFEREGILIEGQSSNYVLNSDDPTKWDTSSSLTKTVLLSDGNAQCPSCKCVINTAVASSTVVGSATMSLGVGDPISISGRVKGNYGFIRIAFVLESTTTASAYIDAQTGVVSSATAGVTVNSALLSDGYISFSCTFIVTTAGNYSGAITAAKLSADTVIPLGTEFYVQMPQCEKNAVATSYIPTGAAAVTRAGDSLELSPLGNVGYRLVGDSFTRTLAFEVSINKFNPTVNYVDLLANWGAKNDIILRCTPNTVRSYRSSGGPTISNVTIPFNSKLYAQTINTFNSNEVASYFDGQSNTTTAGGPVDASTAGTALRFSGNSNAVFHIRNFRIWHRLLTPNQINGLR